MDFNNISFCNHRQQASFLDETDTAQQEKFSDPFENLQISDSVIVDSYRTSPKKSSETYYRRTYDGEMCYSSDVLISPRNLDFDFDQATSDESLNIHDQSAISKSSCKYRIIEDHEIHTKQINSMPESYVGLKTAKILSHKLHNSEARIFFNGRYVLDILKNGYVHWAQLEKTENTDTTILFIQRLHADIAVFGLKCYNDIILDRATSIFNKNPTQFILDWNEQWGTEYPDTFCDVRQLLIDQNLCFSKDISDFEPSPKFGCLFFENSLITNNIDHEEQLNYMLKTYGKSMLILNNDLLKNSTCCLGDSFDNDPSSYAWKPLHEIAKKDILFTLSAEKKNHRNIINRLQSCACDIPYIECHFYKTIRPSDIKHILLSRSEDDKVEEKERIIHTTYNDIKLTITL